MENKICVLTEASDEQIHLTRTAIYSFLETNKWFDGTIYLSIRPGSSISQKNISFLESMYLDIQVAPNLDNPVFGYIETLKINLKQKAELLTATAPALAFTLPDEKILYFSNTSLFLRDISELLTPNKIVVPLDTSSIFYTSLQESSELALSIFDSLLECSVLNPEIIRSTIFKTILDFPESLVESIGYYNSTYFNNKKFNQLKVNLNHAKYLNFDSVSSRRLEFSKVNSIWIQKNHYVFNKYNTPVKSDPALLDSLDKQRRLDLKRKSNLLKNKSSAEESLIPIQKINSDQLIDNCGDSLTNSNLVLCTICNDLFSNGAAVLISSFLSKNTWFNQPIVIFHSAKYSYLSEENKEELLKVYNNIVFKEIDESKYLSVFERFTKIYEGTPNMRFIPSLFTYEAFELTKEYEKVLYLDSDMLVLEDISEIFNLSDEIIVTPDTSNYNIGSSYSTFNGGFLMINSSDYTKELTNQLIEHSMFSNNYKLFEQSMMNEFLNSRVVLVDSRYNCLKRCFPDYRFFKFPKEIKIIHYVGAKPWDSNKKTIEKRYQQIERMWMLEFNKIKNFLN